MGGWEGGGVAENISFSVTLYNFQKSGGRGGGAEVPHRSSPTAGPVFFNDIPYRTGNLKSNLTY